MPENFQLKTDAVIGGLNGARPRLLLQSCCGPCSSYVLEYLTQHFDVTVLFYNPNIQPQSEYEKRLVYQRRVIENIGAKIMECGYEPEAFIETARGLEAEPEGGARCAKCFALRLERTAALAAQGGFDYFCTTLTVSPHKNAPLINAIGAALGEKYGVKWLLSDFKKRGGYQRSIVLSKQLELYRQDYCGCLFGRQREEGLAPTVD